MSRTPRDMPRPARGVISYFVGHRTAANLLLAILVLLGLAAAPQLRAQFFPDVVLDEIDVSVTWRGADPEDIDRAILGPLVPALQQVAGVTESSATARDGAASVRLTFEPDWDMTRARTDVQAAVDEVRDLPGEIDPPSVTIRAWRDRVTDVVLTGPVPVEQLAGFADRMLLALFEAGVTQTQARGVAWPGIVVTVETATLIRHDLTLSEIADRIEVEATSEAAGDLRAANIRLRSGTTRRTAEALADVVLRTDNDGTALRLGDVAALEIAAANRGATYFTGDNPAVSLRIDRGPEGDALAIQHTVEKIGAEIASTLPPEVSIDLIRTRSEAISSRLNILLENGLLGLALVVMLLFLFLNARTALWVAAGIPVAMLTAVAVMYAASLSLNMMSLFGLIITLGIVVDDAIVVGEHADYRARTLGEPPALAAERAAQRMALPVFCAAITTIIAFWALTVIGGRFGTLVREIPITVIAVLAASLVECFLILPNHMKHALHHVAHDRWYDWPSRQVNKGFAVLRDRGFRPLAALVLRARYPVLAGAVALLASQAALFISGTVDWRFFNGPERGSVTGNFAMVSGATRADTYAQLQELQRATEVVAHRFEQEHGVNPLAYVLSQLGGSTGRGLAGAEFKQQDQLGSIAIELVDADARPYTSFQVVRALQQETVKHPLLETLSFRSWRSGPGGDAISVKFYGADAPVLKAAAEDFKRAVSRFPEVSGLDDTMPYDLTQATLELTPMARVLGFEADALASVLRDRLQGIPALRYAEGTRTGTIQVEVPLAERRADFLQRVLMRAPSGQYVPLGDLVRISQEPGFSTIRRENGVRVVTVSGDIAEVEATRASEITDEIRQQIAPDIAQTRQLGWSMSGLAEQERAFLSDARAGFALCLAGIFLTLAWVFASWTRPLAIMAIIPFGFVGTIWGHYVWDIPMSVFTVVGLLGMTGIIINDSIVLITTVDDYARSRSLKRAIVDATADRLRPVLLTTLTTVLGLMPLLYETSRQAQFLKPTVITLVYGLGVGMLLVLLLVPAVLAIGEDLRHFLRRGRRALVPGRMARGVWPARALAVALAVWFAATLGSALVTGALPDALAGALADALARLPGADGVAGAFVLFAAGGLAITSAALLATVRRARRG